ncbi:MAG: hypothetical protein K5745_02920, partial [Saccharofermentans sp.]|nr:hypothetical protein [Saccharofermentans sp.]
MEEFATFLFIIIIAIVSAIILFQLISTVIAAVIGSKTIAKDKSSVFLGYSLITAAASQFLSIFTGVAARTVLLRYVLNASNFNLFASWNYAISFAIMAMNTAFMVLLCLHFIKNYKLGKAHLTVILIASVLTLCAVLAGNLATGQYVTGKISFGLYVA